MQKSEILTSEILELIDKLDGNGSYPNGEFKIVMKDFTVVTVV